MNRLLLFESDRIDDVDGPPGLEFFALDDRRHVHLTTVLSVEVDRRLQVGLWDGPLGEARVVAVEPTRTVVAVEWKAPPPPRPAVHLILAVPRPKSLKKLLPEIVALGVGRLTLIRSWRVALPYLSSPLLTPGAQRPLIEDGLMQAGCTRPPIVEVMPKFRPFVEEVGPTLTADLKLVAHPHAHAALSGLRPGRAAVTLAIGPEGGWIASEVASFEQAGFRPVTLGDRILRVETACVATLANLALLRQID